MLDKQPGSPAQQEQTAAEFRASVAANFEAGSRRMARIEAALEHNAAATDKNSTLIKGMTTRNDEMYEVFNAMKGGFKVLEWFGRVAKWGTGVAAGAAALCKTMGWWPFSN